MYGLELGRSVRRTGAGAMGHIVRPLAQLVISTESETMKKALRGDANTARWL